MTDEAARLADIWANGAVYESYVGRWSRLVARIPRLAGGGAGAGWLDVGCGTAC